MEFANSTKQRGSSHLAEDSSPLYLLEQGLYHIQQGRYAEGVVFFALARDKLSPQHSHLASVLDTFTQGHTVYWQAQLALHDASRRFVEEDAAQQNRLATIEKLLPTLKDELQKRSPVARPAPLQALTHTNGHQSPPTFLLQSSAGEGEALPALYFTCFGRFEVRRLGQSLSLCPNRNGQAILRYLVAQADHRATMDALMDVFWPDDEPEIAHHKLQVAASALRRSLNGDYSCDAGGGYLLCKRQTYQLNPAIAMHSDIEDFLDLYEAGRHTSGSPAIDLYEQACHLYKGPFLVEDLYADWSSLRRGQLRSIYLTMCSILAEHSIEIRCYEDAVMWATAILKENQCDEAAHRQLMRAYAALGRRSEALSQYQYCQRILFEELGVEPMPETVKLFHSLLSGGDSSLQ